MKQQVDDVKKHFAFARIAKINKKIFIPNFMNELLALPVRFVILFVVWSAVFRVMNRTQINGFTLWKMISYYFIYAAIVHIAGYYRQLPYTVWNEVTSGDMSKFICRPISYIKYHFFYGIGYAYYSAIICVPLVVIASLSFFSGIDFLAKVLLFILSLSLGIIVTFYVHILVGFVSFWTEAIFGYRDLILHIGSIFSGGIIPLSFMPGRLQHVSDFLPFRYMVYDPICILIYKYSLLETAGIIIKQGVCILVLGIVARLLWRIGLKRYEAQGG